MDNEEIIDRPNSTKSKMVSFLSMHPAESRYWERGRDDVVEKAHILCGSLIMMAMIQYWWPLMLSS